MTHYAYPSHVHAFRVLSHLTFQIKGPLYPAIALTVMAGGNYIAYRVHDHYFQKWKAKQMDRLKPLAQQLLEDDVNNATAQQRVGQIVAEWQRLAQEAPNKWFGHPLGLWGPVLIAAASRIRPVNINEILMNAMQRYYTQRFDAMLRYYTQRYQRPRGANEPRFLAIDYAIWRHVRSGNSRVPWWVQS